MNKEKLDSLTLPPHVEIENKMYPQGGNDKVLLRDKFAQQMPFYLRENKPTIYRYVDE